MVEVVRKREAVNAIRLFVNTVSTLTHTIKGENVKTHIAIAKDNYGFATKVYWFSPTLTAKRQTIYYNFESLNSEPVSIFRYFWSTVAPELFDEFSPVTFAILHELGHLYITDEVKKIGYSYEHKRIELEKIQNESESLEEMNGKYFLLPDEKEATLWAIRWLSDKHNREIAKTFEKNFFKCCKKSA